MESLPAACGLRPRQVESDLIKSDVPDRRKPQVASIALIKSS